MTAINKLPINIDQAVSDFDDIKDALKTKGVPFSGFTPTSEYASKIISIQTSEGNVVAMQKDVNFYDYDGTLLHSYTIAEAALLSQLPAGPTNHERLKFQEWNWTLEDIQATDRAIDVGATYTTKSGASEFDITLSAVTGLSITLRIYNVTSGNTITVDWGDGEIVNETAPSVGLRSFTHTFSSIGNYTIKVDSTGYYRPYGASTSPYNMFNTTPNYTCTAVYLGDRCNSIQDYSFYNCYSIKNITIPNTVVIIFQRAFYNCFSFTNINLPKSITTLDQYIFYSNFSLVTVSIPNSVFSIGNYVFQNCYSLKNAIIPNLVTGIGIYAFGYCRSLRNATVPSVLTTLDQYAFGYRETTIKYIMQRATPPTMTNSNVFFNINAICVIEVPKGSLAAYQTATNWVAYASYMREAE